MDDYEITALRERMPDYLATVHGITDTRRSFRCLNPEHDDHSPSMGYDPHSYRVHCFSCGASWDIFDLAAIDHHLSATATFPEKVKAVVDALGERIEDHEPVGRKPLHWEPVGRRSAKDDAPDILDAVEEAAFDLFMEPEACAALEYLKGRGFDGDHIVYNMLGWVKDPRELMPDGFGYLRPREGGYIVMPFLPDFFFPTKTMPGDFTCHYAVVRPVRRNPKEPKEYKPRGLTAPLWHSFLLDTPQTKSVCVVEGVFDAIALDQIYGEKDDPLLVVAVMGSGTRRLVEIIKDTPEDERSHIVLAFDSDDAGMKKRKEVAEGLTAIGVLFGTCPAWPFGCKDADDALMKWGRNDYGE